MDNYKTNVVHECLFCAKVFKYESDKRRHENSHYPQHTCNICGKKFSFLSALKRHKKQHDRSGTVKCDKCGKSFKDDMLLQRHYDYAHKGTCVCKHCKSRFHSSLALKNHMKVHKKIEDRKYICKYSDCQKTFYSAHHLKNHELKHTNTKQYFCDDCGKGFIQLNHLKCHVMMHRPEDWLPCSHEGCKKKFPTKYAIKRHLETHRKKVFAEIQHTIQPIDKIKINESQKKINKKTKNTNQVMKQLQSIIRDGFISDNLNKIYFNNSCSKPNHNSLNKIENSMKDSKEDYDIESNVDLSYEMAEIDKMYSNKTCNKPNNKNLTKLENTTRAVEDDYEEINTKVDLDYKMAIEIITADDEASKQKHKDNSSEIELCQEPDDISVNEDSLLNQTNTDAIDDFRCGNCDCKSIKLKDLDFINNINDQIELPLCKKVMPNLEQREDGAIKLADTFEFEQTGSDDDVNMNHSCIDLCGTCLVSGDNQISDKCICVKIPRLNNSQEIGEITPCSST